MNLFGRVLITAFLGAGLAGKTLARSHRLKIPRNKQPQSEGRKLTNFQCTLVIKAIEYEDKHGEEIPECQLPGSSLPTPLVNMPTWLSEKFVAEEIVSNVDSLELSEALLYGEGIYIPAGAQASLVKGTDDRRRRLANKTTYTLMAMRITNSGQTGPSLTNAGFADSIFGDAGDVFNLKSGYAQCSNNAFQFTPGTGNGVVDVTTSTSNDDDAITNAALSAAGLNGGGSYDYVMSCVPNDTFSGGSTSWIAYAYINHWLSVYRGPWCSYPSAQMHEIGHNINLAHSGETATYDDQSGMMGYSYSNDEGPVMCFNGAKYYQLGWMSDRHVSISNGAGWSGNLYGISTYSSSSAGDATVVRIDASPDIYVSYNKKSGINSGTVEGGNQVLVHTKSASPNSYGVSVLVSKLNSGGSVTVGGNTITFQSTSSNYAVVQINTSAPNPTPPPTSGPNPNPTPPPTSGPNPNPTPFPTSGPNPNPTPPPTSGPNPNPTPSPTSGPNPNPTPPPTPLVDDDDDLVDDDGFCVDDPNFRFTKKNGKKKGCAWFGRKKKRCFKKPGALDACPDSCNICDKTDSQICSDSRMNPKACKNASFCSWDRDTRTCS